LYNLHKIIITAQYLRNTKKDQINYDQGGYYYVYSPTDPSKIADDMQRLLNDWYAKMGQLIQEFEANYEQSETATPAAES